MSKPPDDDKVGYGRPPKKSRWKKGESGNPRKKPKAPESLAAMIDRLLLSPKKLAVNGEIQTVPALVGIISRLQSMAIAGNTRVSKILLKYRVFANQHTERHFQLIFKEAETTGATANSATESDRG